MKLDQEKALVLFSGGQDSAICLAWALEKYRTVETIGFEYGQRHSVELTARQKVREKITGVSINWTEKLGEDRLLDLSYLSDLGATAMTDEIEIRMAESGLPNTFVAGRNLAFFVAAAAYAYRRNIGVLIGGMCETDYSGYPDCRSEALAAQVNALRLGMDADFSLKMPLMHLNKAQSWELADQLGGQALIDLVLEESHTCYLGKRGVRHDWGYGCGECPACELRRNGWREYRGILK